MGIPICITLAQIATIKRLISRLVATSEVSDLMSTLLYQ
ncbi:hypothetical protein L917_02488 [Phytophthora nicotianae]|uniref:Uncharacterized protein n=1 Tax=Phytophthora nicotianae TaxID=4792 RepID=W2LVX4_PHYNI|nr:hypothetical protein L917_02488 [Phytophthora nicotianae]